MSSYPHRVAVERGVIEARDIEVGDVIMVRHEDVAAWADLALVAHYVKRVFTFTPLPVVECDDGCTFTFSRTMTVRLG